MLLTAELNLYPLRTEYVPPVRAFVTDLAARDRLAAQTNAKSTQLNGEASAVLAAAGKVLAHSHAAYRAQALPCKFIAGKDLLAEAS